MTEANYTNTIIDKHHCPPDGDSERLDKLLAKIYPEVSRAALQALISDGHVRVDGAADARRARRVCVGQTVAVDERALAAHAPEQRCAPEAIALDIVFEDADIIVVNKPAGMVTHPGHGNTSGTLQSALLHHHPAADRLVRGGIVHRLDKDTSGLLVAAKSEKAQKNLISQFAARSIRREYLALVHGVPEATGLISEPIAKSRRNPMKMAIGRHGKEAITHFHVQQAWHNFALLRCHLKTGRTHQIRLHLEHHGYPVVGDAVYNKRARPEALDARRQLLHAIKLELIHPATQTVLQWETEPAPDLCDAINTLNESA